MPPKGRPGQPTRQSHLGHSGRFNYFGHFGRRRQLRILLQVVPGRPLAELPGGLGLCHGFGQLPEPAAAWATACSEVSILYELLISMEVEMGPSEDYYPLSRASCGLPC